MADDAILSAYDALPVPVWVSTSGEQSRWFNKAWLELTGRPVVPAHLRDWERDIHPDDVASNRDFVANGQNAISNYRLRRGDGSYAPIEEMVAPRLAADGATVIGDLGVARELTARDQPGHKPLSPHDAHLLGMLVDGIAEHGVFMMDAAGTIVTWNTGAANLKGYAAHEIIGRNYEVLFGPEDRAAGLPHRILKSVGTYGKFEGEGWRLKKDGSRFRAQVIVDAIRDGKGNLVGFAKVTRDITEQFNAKSLIEETRDRLSHVQKMESIGQLTGGIAHDFNNLLTIILGNAEMLERALAAHPLQHLAEMTRIAAERGAKLTNHLLAYARRQPLAPEIIDVNVTMTAMDTLLRRSLGEHIEVEIIRAGGLWPAVADPAQLESAILNLGINARDAMPAGGKLTIEVANVYLDPTYAGRNIDVDPGQYVMIAVSDTGTGMTSEVASRAFEPFFTTKGPGKGSELGLSMVHGFIKQSSGHIKIYSEPGHGTTIKMYLPRSENALAPTATNIPTLKGPLGASRILLVEDDDLVREHVAAQLHSLGFEVESTRNGPEAMAKLLGGQVFDVLFTDVVMPGMSGRQLADEAFKIKPNLAILFTSGYTDNAIIHHGRLDPGIHFLSKPYRREDLANKLRLVLADAASKLTSG